ncbi:MAG TPA: sensor histidine kinase [Desulfobacteraceae bacterium]|nr:sensor histidine kinase [Desulfobacteraceae bacterium]
MTKHFSLSIKAILNTVEKSRILIDSIGRDETQSGIAFSRILLLRWGAILCQTLLVVAAYIFFKTVTPLPLLILIIGFGGASNIIFHYLYIKRNRTIPGGLFAMVMFLDIILLTALLHYTGGPMNPFTFLFLIHISLGAILMRSSWAWGLAVFTTLSYATLFYLPQRLSALEHSSPDNLLLSACQPNSATGSLLHTNMSLHLQGMWLAFAITVFFIVFFVNKIQEDLEDHQKTLNELELEKNRSEKLASLATLSAGAAHEFSTPLATIAVASGEMLTTLKQQSADPELIDDTKLIREQVERCREILYQMSADAGEHLAEALRTFTIEELCDDVLDWFPENIRGRIKVVSDIKEMSIRMPFRTVKRIIRGLIKNAVDASEETGTVTLTCRRDSDFLYFEVRDEGKGMDEETMARAIEPFFTTKEPGKGLGLGLFLTESAAERFGGSLQLDSKPGKGTRAVISFSLEQVLYR